jgi:hypothetical protein
MIDPRRMPDPIRGPPEIRIGPIGRGSADTAAQDHDGIRGRQGADRLRANRPLQRQPQPSETIGIDQRPSQRIPTDKAKSPESTPPAIKSARASTARPMENPSG